MEEKPSTKLGTNLKSFRVTKRFSQEQLAEIISVSRSYISNIENGKINPTLSTTTKLADAVGVSVGELANKKVAPETNNSKLPPKIELLISEIKNAGQVARNSFIKNEVVYFKEKINKSDIVTDIDLRLEKILTRVIRKHFPEIEIRSEESFGGKLSNVYKDLNVAIIAPLDGTANFFTNIPYFCLSVFLNSNKDGTFGIIYDPITDMLLVGGSNKLELRQGGDIIVIYTKDKLLPKKKISLKDATCAVISNYNIPPSVTEPFIHYLYSRGVKRVLSHWSPAHDYMNLIMNKYDCVISLSKPGFSEAAGLFFVEQSENHALDRVNKNIMSKKYSVSVSTNNSYTKLITNLVKNYKAA